MTWKRAEAAMAACREREAQSASEAGQSALVRARNHLRSSKYPNPAPLPSPQIASESVPVRISGMLYRSGVVYVYWPYRAS
eukprot:6125898-Prymnesium_polylepis.1